MSAPLPDTWIHAVELVDRYLQKHSEVRRVLASNGLARLREAMDYSLLSGGKRFRPVLSVLSAQALGRAAETALPFGVAVEFVHAYSLIHDDLPCMDNDDYRRGKLTNHRVFGEAMALLAGSALYAEAIGLVLRSYSAQPKIALEAALLLVDSSGFTGMLGGQALDIYARDHQLNSEDIFQLHKMKTGALIEASVVGAAIVCQAEPAELAQLRSYSRYLGEAFQVADDIQDAKEDGLDAADESGNVVKSLGLSGAKAHLASLTQQALASLETWSPSAEGLRAAAQFNFDRIG